MIYYAIVPQRYNLDTTFSTRLVTWVQKYPEKFSDLLSKHNPRTYGVEEVDFGFRADGNPYLLAEADSEDALFSWIEMINCEIDDIEDLDDIEEEN